MVHILVMSNFSFKNTKTIYSKYILVHSHNTLPLSLYLPHTHIHTQYYKL